MATISETEARSNIGKLWRTAAQGPVTVESAGRPIAVVLSPEEYDRISARRPARTPQPRQAGTGKSLLAGVDINALLAVDIAELFEGPL